MINELAISLRPTTIEDLEWLFQFQLDPEANYLAAFISGDPADKTAYINKYQKLLSDPTINNQTILVGNVIAGSIAKFMMQGEAEITYWIDRKCWKQGIATQALQQFLQQEPSRPLHGRTAFDNIGSQRVLEKCGFVKIGTDKGYANARQAEIEEYIYQLV
ncbi:GNAT family N-acetyltransferase [Flavihumibacter cheonanensis]|uniref:GNAT family N-acetyltransferase n=1 Tax=Flavihumibacter cheonanensis TaxID=1442385 RepID=UPI001EF83302|nr:GNAT family N-acetyltransferase [Flavihumibacter cheonanensis]MCG7752751.1 GNAT family N-acetyltransferase [Flavihumibacter cheonanensis]